MIIRHLNPEEADLAVKLSDAVFRDPNQKSMGEAFPAMFSPLVLPHSYGAFVDGQLVAFTGLVPSVIRVGQARLSVYSLGSVCTDPAHRGKGYVSRMLQEIVEELKHSEASLMLVSGERSLYTRMGCRMFGRVSSFSIDPQAEEKRQVHDAQIRVFAPPDIHGLARLASLREVAYEQTVHELDLLIGTEAYASCMHCGHQVLIAEREGIPSAFLVIAVPYQANGQRKGTAVEWAGDPVLIRSLLLDAGKRYNLENVTIKVPWQERKLIEALSAYDQELERNQGTVYIVNRGRLLDQAAPYFGSRASLPASTQLDAMDEDRMTAFFFDPKTENAENEGLAIPLPYTAGLNYV